MERHLGRYLTRKEVVHHKNKLRWDNCLYNLRLFPSHSAHLRWEKQQESPCYNPQVVEMVRIAAVDPTVRVSDLPISNVTVLKICKMHGIQWVSAGTRHLNEDQVREALRGRTTLAAAKLLGCNHQTLRNKFDHLLMKRKSPTLAPIEPHGLVDVPASQ
jgi:hypothetical protein